MNSRKVASGLIIFIFLLISCGPAGTPVPPKEEPGTTQIKEQRISGGETWEKKWERTLLAAKKEGNVVVYGGSAAAALKTNATKIVKEKFGLNLEVVSGRGTEILARTRAERSNGIFIPDINASGINPFYDPLKLWGALDPMQPVLILPEVLDQKLWFEGRIPWGDDDRMVFIWAGSPDPAIAINTNLVKPGEIKSYQDLLDHRWKGKIVANDPTDAAASGFVIFSALLYNKVVDLDFFRKIAAQQQITVMRDQQLQIAWLAMGKFPIALWPSHGRMAEYKHGGAPMEWVVTREGLHLGSGGGGFVLMNKAPHPNAAAILLNWLLSREGQILLQNSVDKQSLRIDVPSENLDPVKTRQPGVKYFSDPNNIEKWVLQEKDKYLEMAREIFNPLMGR